MRVLLVLAGRDGVCRELADAAARGLAAAGHEVDRIDLHAEGFRAAMSNDERRAYETDQPILDPQVADHARRLTAVEALVFVYPTGMTGLPAVLKGWLERVLVPGVGFEFDERTGKVRPGLRRVRHLVGISVYAPARWRVGAATDGGRRVLTRALRLACGWRARPRWLALYALDPTDDDRCLAFARRVERSMAGL